MKAPVAFLLLVGLVGPAGSSPLDTLYCRAWPNSPACRPAPLPPRPAPAPAPKAVAPVPAPKVDTGRPMPSGPVVAKPQAKPKAAVRVKAKPKAAKRKRVVRPRAAPARRLTDRDLTTGECLKIRAANFAGYGIDDVKAAARKRGHEMSFKQIEQAKDCLAGRR